MEDDTYICEVNIAIKWLVTWPKSLFDVKEDMPIEFLFDLLNLLFCPDHLAPYLDEVLKCLVAEGGLSWCMTIL